MSLNNASREARLKSSASAETFDRAAVSGPADLRASFKRVRAYTDSLVAPLGDEDRVVQSMPDASPAKWHLAHTTWFFETFLLIEHLPGYEVFDPSFAYLFNSYYEALGPRQPRHSRGLMTRPTSQPVAAHRADVDTQMESLLDS